MENYDFKNRLASTTFLSWAPFLFYIDFMRKIGISRNPYSFGFYSYYWEKAAIPLILTILYVGLLFHFSLTLESKVKEEHKKMLPIVNFIFMILCIVGNAVLFGTSNKLFLTRLGIAAFLFLLMSVFSMLKKDSVAKV